MRVELSSNEEEEGRKEEEEEEAGKKKSAPFWSLVPSRRGAPCTPELLLSKGTVPDLRRGARAGNCVALRLGMPFTTMHISVFRVCLSQLCI